MTASEVEIKINEVLALRKNKAVNRNAIKALFGAFSDPVAALGTIFLGRADAIDSERQKIQQELVLELLCKIDESLSQFLSATNQKGIVVDGLIETWATDAHEVTGLEISNTKNVRLQPGTQVRTVTANVGRVVGLKISSD